MGESQGLVHRQRAMASARRVRSAASSAALVLLALAGPVATSAQTPPTAPAEPASELSPPPPPPGERPDERFDTELPGTVGKGRVQFGLRPRWEDLLDRRSLRVPVEVKWGVTRRFDAIVGLSPFLNNPFRSFGTAGPGGLTLGAKLRVRAAPRSRNDLSVGARMFQPFGSPPSEVTDGYARFVPFVAFSHRHGKVQGLETFVSASHELVEEPWWIAPPALERPLDQFSVRPGFLWRRGRWRSSLELPVRTDRFDGGTTDAVFLKPGLSWIAPPGFGRKIFLRDGVEIGAFVEFGLHDTDDDLSAGGKIRLRLDSSAAWRRLRGRTGPASTAPPV